MFRYAAAIALVHGLMLVSYSHLWWGGHSYGPRLFTDILPFLTFCTIPFLQRWTESSRPQRAVFLALLAFSAFVHARGALSPAVHRWNVDPVNIDQHTARARDWSDPQFLRR